LRHEAKFENGDYCDSGPTRRRYVQATQINYIGKEANRWEEQFFLGMDEDAVIEYGTDPNMAALFDELIVAVGKFGKPQLASRIGISRNSLTKILDIKCQNLSPRISQKIGSAIAVLNSRWLEEENQNSNLLGLASVEVAKIGLSQLARRLEIDTSNLSKLVDGSRKFKSVRKYSVHACSGSIGAIHRWRLVTRRPRPQNEKAIDFGRVSIDYS
jgi:DNA-binding Xre family transcriptional regulator